MATVMILAASVVAAGPHGDPSAARPSKPLATPQQSAREELKIPDVGLSAPLVPIRFSGDVLEPPEDVSRAGIWADGAPLASDAPGTTVITGHVSDRADRPGEFAKLQHVEAGMIATTVDERGAIHTWRVKTVRRVAKEALGRDEFLPDAERRLRLISCTNRVSNGKKFHYTENLIVDLEPADEQTQGHLEPSA